MERKPAKAPKVKALHLKVHKLELHASCCQIEKNYSLMVMVFLLDIKLYLVCHVKLLTSLVAMTKTASLQA